MKSSIGRFKGITSNDIKDARLRNVMSNPSAMIQRIKTEGLATKKIKKVDKNIGNLKSILRRINIKGITIEMDKTRINHLNTIFTREICPKRLVEYGLVLDRNVYSRKLPSVLSFSKNPSTSIKSVRKNVMDIIGILTFSIKVVSPFIESGKSDVIIK